MPAVGMSAPTQAGECTGTIVWAACQRLPFTVQAVLGSLAILRTHVWFLLVRVISVSRPTADDGNDVLEVMARKKITVSAAFERFELRGDKNWRGDELYRMAARKRHWAGGGDGERIPTIVEAQDTGL